MDRPTLSAEELRRERTSRVRIGATGLAFIVLIILLAVSISGTASNEPELTPEAIAEQEAADSGEPTGEEAKPQEPLAELGVAPSTGPAEEPGTQSTGNTPSAE